MGGSYENLELSVLVLFLDRILLLCAAHKLHSTNLLRKYSIFDFSSYLGDSTMIYLLCSAQIHIYFCFGIQHRGI